MWFIKTFTVLRCEYLMSWSSCLQSGVRNIIFSGLLRFYQELLQSCQKFVCTTVVFLLLIPLGSVKIRLSPGYETKTEGFSRASPCNTVSYNMPVRKQGVISVDRRTPIWPPAKQDSWLGPTRVEGGRRRRKRARVVWITATRGFTGLMGKLWLLKSGNVWGEVWRRRQLVTPAVTFGFLAPRPDCGRRRQSAYIHTYNRRGKSLFFFLFFFPSPLPCPAAGSGYTIRLFLAAQSAPALSWLS